MRLERWCLRGSSEVLILQSVSSSSHVQRLDVQLKNWFMLSLRISSYGCTREVWRARKKRKSCSRRSREQL